MMPINSQVTYKIELNNIISSISPVLPLMASQKLQYDCSYIPKGIEFSPRVQMGKWDGSTKLFNANKQTFPTGLLYKVRSILSELNIPYEIIDSRVRPEISSIPLYDIEDRDYQIFATNEALEYTRGTVKMATGCHPRGTQILLYDGSVKNVENITTDDILMGDDNTPRKIFNLCRGVGKIYKIIPHKGDPFFVNEYHILTLKRTNVSRVSRERRYPKIVDISLRDYFLQSKEFKHLYKLHRVPINFNYEQEELKIDPYFLGVLIGDGCLSHSSSVSTPDREIKEEIYNQSEKWGLKVTEQIDPTNKAVYYSLVKLSGFLNPLSVEIKKLGLNCKSGFKFIPHKYKITSKENKLQILAGLMDTDGSLGNNVYDYITKSKQLSDDIVFICRSLGLSANAHICTKHCQNNFSGQYYRICISGNTDMIPCRLERKKASPRLQKKDVLVVGFRIEDTNRIEDYYGFKLDGNGRYILSDFTVTHNSGKTSVLARFIANTNIPTLIVVNTNTIFQQTVESIKRFLHIDAGQIGDGVVEPKKITVGLIQSLVNYRDNEDILNCLRSCQAFLCDESQHVSCKTYRDVAKQCINAYYRLNFSATPFREDNADMLLDCYAGRKIVDISASQLIQMGYLSKPTINLVDFKHQRQPKELKYQQLYDKEIVHNEARNLLIRDIALKHMFERESVLIIVTRIEHGRILQDMISKEFFPNLVRFVNGEDDSELAMSSLKDLHNKSINCLIGTSIFKEGANVPSLDCLISCRCGDSSVGALQTVGRALRRTKDKSTVVVYDITDYGCRWISEHSKNRELIYSTEPEFEIKHISSDSICKVTNDLV